MGIGCANSLLCDVDSEIFHSCQRVFTLLIQSTFEIRVDMQHNVCIKQFLQFQAIITTHSTYNPILTITVGITVKPLFLSEYLLLILSVSVFSLFDCHFRKLFAIKSWSLCDLIDLLFRRNTGMKGLKIIAASSLNTFLTTAKIRTKRLHALCALCHLTAPTSAVLIYYKPLLLIF